MHVNDIIVWENHDPRPERHCASIRRLHDHVVAFRIAVYSCPPTCNSFLLYVHGSENIYNTVPDIVEVKCDKCYISYYAGWERNAAAAKSGITANFF